MSTNNINNKVGNTSSIRSFHRSFHRFFRSLKNTPTSLSAKLLYDLQNGLAITENLQKSYTEAAILPPHTITPGQNLILIGNIGSFGTALMARHFAEDLRRRFPAWMIQDALQLNILDLPRDLEDISFLTRHHVTAAYPLGEGGLSRTLYQFGKDTGKGFQLQVRKVPVSQITIEFCEYYDLNPFSLLSCGCTLLVCTQSASLLEWLRQRKIPAAIVGYTTGNKDKVLTYDTTNSLLGHPEPDALLRFLLSK